MKKDFTLIFMVLLGIILISGCMNKTITLIDWTDFVKWDGISYERGGSDVLVPTELIGDRIGFVAKAAPTEVSSPDYKPEDGMASFLPIGTEFFGIEGYDSSKYIAVYTDGDYILYRSLDSESISFREEEYNKDQNGGVNDLKPTIYETVNNLEGVTMAVKEGTVSTTGLTLEFVSDTDKKCIYGEFFLLEKRINEKWYQVPITIEAEYGFNDIGYELNPGSRSEWRVNWNWLYGSLEAGDYRIVKDILDFRKAGDFDAYYLAAGFTIE